jgi:DNA invertase Pin-like site-specific DNA recombinase
MESVKKYVAYYRVSTQKQGQSGLGLDGQQIEVKRFVGSHVLLAEFTEVESGKKSNRKELEKAIAFAKKQDATLLVAKLDRLSRDAYFTFKLQSEKVAFICCDNPHANQLSIGIMAVIAQDEAKRISERTKAALGALKERRAKAILEQKPYKDEIIESVEWRKGVWTDDARLKGMQTIKEKAANNVHIKRAKRYAETLRKQNMTLEQIANQLNEDGFLTARGKTFHKTSVMRLLE